jgi:TRAP-type C4-dicarboxylate transport system substrate-binding protein
MYKRQHRADSGLARFKPRVIRHLSQVLHLTPEQRRVIEPLVSQAEAALLDLRMKHQPRVEEIVHTAAMQIKATLTADQQIAFDELLTALQARWRKDRMYADQQLAPHTPR